jgi:hypothetical protein
LYWIDADNIVSGECQKDKPKLRSYCQLNPVTRTLSDANSALYGNARGRQSQLQTDATELRSQLAAIDAALAADPGNVSLSAERQRVAIDLRNVNDALAAVATFTAQVDDFFAKILNERIVYTVDPAGERYPERKPHVQALAAFFRQVPPAAPAATWSDELTGRQFAAINDRYNWSTAQTVCQQIPDGSWVAILGFVGGACSDDVELGKRLFNSSLMSVIPSTRIGGEQETSRKHVWSRCYYNNGLSIAVSLDAHNALQHRATSGDTQLPVI